jgi:glycosyltransferase involved in cell wall biosynthesis
VVTSNRPLFISTYPPEECGLATFTKDTAAAVDWAARRPVSSVMAIEKNARQSTRHPRVVHVIDNQRADAYRRAAEFANDSDCTVVSLQHEFGLYPGEWGRRVLDFVHYCEKPLVTTLHTLFTRPNPLPRRLLDNIIECSQGLVVMTQTAAQILTTVHGVSPDRIRVIPHGIPSVPFERDPLAKQAFGLEGRPVVCSFGLINPEKKLEFMIQALPRIVERFPDVLYLVVGATHPFEKHRSGERYRESLEQLAQKLGVGKNVRFVNQYLDLDGLLKYLQACDVFVTPYQGRDQIASGTLSYALGAVGAVISTPYLFAAEVLADGRGILVPFGESEPFVEATLKFLENPEFRLETCRRAYAYARKMFWPIVGQQYLNYFQEFASFAPAAIHSPSLASPRPCATAMAPTPIPGSI